MAKSTCSQGGGINVGGSSTVTIQGDMVGGDKVINIGNVTVAQYVGGQLPLELQLAFFGSEIGMRSIRAAKFESAKFEAYSDTWKSLQALDLAADDLWETANPENLLKFVRQLRDTQLVVQQGELYFDESDRSSLLRLMERMGDYRLGKERLVRLYAAHDRPEQKEYLIERIRQEWNSLEDWATSIPQQIRSNGEYRREYQNMLEKIRISFRRRLAH